MPGTQTIITQTKRWLSSIVIAQNLCPFAKREFDSGRIHYQVIETSDTQSQLEQLIEACAELDKDAARETSLLILPNGLSDYGHYLDVLALATDLLKAQGYDGIYQLASFHPRYQFAGTPPDDASHYTNRSPYPMLHILREASVEEALKHYSNPEDITARNVKLMQEMGVEAMRDLLSQCYE